MKLDIKYTKLANQFFFISNLSEWAPYCRKEYNDFWLKNNPTDNKEREALLEMSNLLKRNVNLSKIFLATTDTSETWKTVKKSIGENDFEMIQDIFNVFSSRFDKLWIKEEKNLEKIKNEIKSIFSISNKILSLFKILFEVSETPDLISVFLITNPIKERVVYGGQGLGNNKVAIECSEVTEKNNFKHEIVRVILHEAIHASFQNETIEKIDEYINSEYFEEKHMEELVNSSVFKQVKSLKGVINEMILVSLLPEGYLAEKYFDFDVMENLKERKCIKEKKMHKNYYDLMLYAVYDLYSIAKEYCENKKSIDKEYIEFAIKCWKKFEKTDLSKFTI